MFGVSESKEPIKGKFAKKIIKEVAKMWEQKMKPTYIANKEFENAVQKSFYNIIKEWNQNTK